MRDLVVKNAENEAFKRFMNSPVIDTVKKPRLTNVGPLCDGQREAYMAGYENGLHDINITLFGDKKQLKELYDYHGYSQPKSNFGKFIGTVALCTAAYYGVYYCVQKHKEKKAHKALIEQLKEAQNKNRNKED